MANIADFDASQVEPSAGFEAFPSGKYVAAITASEMKPTKKGNGKYLQLTFQILDGQYKNRLLWVRLNLENQNAEAVKIARGELSAICRAVNVLKPGDSQALHNRPMIINVKCSKREDAGEITNEISSYKPLDGSAAAAPTAAAAAAPAPAVAQPAGPAFTAGSTAPWKRS